MWDDHGQVSSLIKVLVGEKFVHLSHGNVILTSEVCPFDAISEIQKN